MNCGVDDKALEGQYTLHDTIGSGGFGKVKLATHILTGEKVAIKIIDKKAIGDDLPRVETELKALKVLCHQNVCRLYQALETEPKYYFVLEYCAGGELFDYIVKKECLAESEARHFFRQIVASMAYVHNCHFAHRDLKPENLLLTEDLQIKVIDFGLCANPGAGLAQNVLQTCCGSPAYAAPELIQGHAYLGNQVDIWSMGVLLYALLCGCLPFEDDNVNVLYQKIARGKYTDPTWLSESSRRILRGMLQTNPAKRLNIDQLLQHEWVLGDYSQPLKWKSIYDKNMVDEEVATEMGKYYSVPLDRMVETIKKWNYDHLTATYFLLLARKRKRRPVILPLNPKHSIKKKRDDPNILQSPTIHSSLDSGLDSMPGEFVHPGHSRMPPPSLEFETGSDGEDEEVPLNSRELPPPPIPALRLPQPQEMTPINRKSRQNEKENVPVQYRDHGGGTKHLQPPNTSTRPNTVYSQHPPSSRRKSHDSRRDLIYRLRKNPPCTPLKTTNERSYEVRVKETPLAKHLRNGGIVRGEGGEMSESSPRTPRSQKKTPQQGTPGTKQDNKLGRRMFASVERTKDRMLNLITPRRPHHPTTSYPNKLTKTKNTMVNISSTSSNDPQLVMDQLTRVFGEKGITCEHHGWKIHGKAKNRQGRTLLTLELEIVYIEHLETIGIKRKRLNGDAFYYKRVCEDILKLAAL